MTKFEMGAAWEDSLALLKSHTALTGTIAAVFLFLPALVVAWVGPTPIEPQAGATLEQISAAVRANLLQILPYQIVVALFTIVGTIAVMRLWLARTSTSVGEALGFSLLLFPTVLIAQILSGLLLFCGFVLLIVPGLYLVGRLTLVLPAIADRRIRNPIAAITTSWDMTRGNGWAVFLFLFLVTLVIVIGSMIISGVTGIAAGSGVGRIVGGAIQAGFGAIATMVSIAVSTAAYRQLAVGRSADPFL